MARANGEACVQVFFIRGGKLIGREYFVLEGAEESPDAEVMAEFLKQFYDQAPSVPAQVLLPNEIEEVNIIQRMAATRAAAGKRWRCRCRAQGQQQELVQMAAENAAETLAALQAQWEADTNRQEQALAELQHALGLPRATQPHRMLRYLQHPGHRRGGQHGGLRAGCAQEKPLPAFQYPNGDRAG